MEKNERWGAFIAPSKIKKIYNGSGKAMFFDISIGKYDKTRIGKQEMFTTNPQISERIAEINKMQKLDGKVETGFIDVIILPGEKVVRLGSYYPFSGSGNTTSLRQDLRRFLTRLGLASRIELRVLEHLKKKFPSYNVAVQQATALDARMNQLRKRGSLGPRKPVPNQEEINKIARYVGSFAKKRK